jgi:hypothetical protein
VGGQTALKLKKLSKYGIKLLELALMLDLAEDRGRFLVLTN